MQNAKFCCCNSNTLGIIVYDYILVLWACILLWNIYLHVWEYSGSIDSLTMYKIKNTPIAQPNTRAATP